MSVVVRRSIVKNGRHLMEVQLRMPASAGDLRLFAHPDDAVVETFVQLIREEMRK